MQRLSACRRANCAQVDEDRGAIEARMTVRRQIERRPQNFGEQRVRGAPDRRDGEDERSPLAQRTSPAKPLDGILNSTPDAPMPEPCSL